MGERENASLVVSRKNSLFTMMILWKEKCMGKTGAHVPFLYFNSLFAYIHKIVSQQAHAQLPFAFSGRFSATFLWRFFALSSFP